MGAGSWVDVACNEEGPHRGWPVVGTAAQIALPESGFHLYRAHTVGTGVIQGRPFTVKNNGKTKGLSGGTLA
jgi:hypothetical protein